MEDWTNRNNNIPFGSRLNVALKAKGMKNKELAKKICVSNSNISKYLHSQHYPNVPILIDIAKELNVSVDWLLGLTNGKLENSVRKEGKTELHEEI